MIIYGAKKLSKKKARDMTMWELLDIFESAISMLCEKNHKTAQSDYDIVRTEIIRRGQAEDICRELKRKDIQKEEAYES